MSQVEFVKEEEMPELRNMLRHLLSLEEGLTDREIDFLDSLNNDWKSPCFSEKQAAWLRKIYEKKA